MKSETSDELNIQQLEELTGQPRRNIRFLIAEQVVPEPRGKSRWASYGPEHVRALTVYAELKAAGIHSLDVIRQRIRLAAQGGEPLVVAPMPGVEIRIEEAVLTEMGADALVERIGEAVRQAAERRKRGELE